MDTSEFALGNRITTALKRAGITQSELARGIGIGRAAISQWLRGGSPSDENLRKAAVLLKVNYEWLATGRGPTAISHPLVRQVPDGKRTSLQSLNKDATDSLRAAMKGRKAEIWTLAGNQLVGAGYAAGDLVLVDLGQPAKARDIVLAYAGQVAIFRLFLPPYLYATPPPGVDPPQALVVDNISIVVRGVVYARFHFSQSHGA